MKGERLVEKERERDKEKAGWPVSSNKLFSSLSSCINSASFTCRVQSSSSDCCSGIRIRFYLSSPPPLFHFTSPPLPPPPARHPSLALIFVVCSPSQVAAAASSQVARCRSSTLERVSSCLKRVVR